MSNEFLEEILSTLPSGARAVASMAAPTIASNPTFQAVADVVSKLAENDGLAISTFLKSGRALEVLRSLAAGQGQPGRSDIHVTKCPKCNHVQYALGESS